MKTCSWCNNVKPFRAQVCGCTMPMVCRDCGGKVADLDWEAINHIIIERDYYKKKFYEQTLTKPKR